ncbi:putative ATP-dependent RNA helicase rha-2 [Tritrichomonas foetus]|uniref:RNA helicase n=1 Tax=Tritrichomonas foetus TaxID=1144522 RepID=A0A1J4KZR8_9EUKA|nr:putative ATP-dependent RNA helicase rha-2 [Tritrichomonas foetus]|eukprot:OHT15188.1 putative ATP-dependent RNA helicase rha-2 [Tritrichomonas foetus]
MHPVTDDVIFPPHSIRILKIRKNYEFTKCQTHFYSKLNDHGFQDFPMSNQIFDEKIKEELPLDDANAVYDRKKAVELAPVQQLNKHQFRQQRKLNLGEKQKSKSSTKKEKAKEARRRMLEKYQRRDEILKNASKVQLTEKDETFITPTSLLGKKLTKRQRYEEAIKRQSLGLPFDQSIIDEVEKKKATTKFVEVTLDQDSSDDSDIDLDIPTAEPVKPAAPLIKIVKEAPKIEEKKDTESTDEQKQAEPRPAINVQLNRPEGVAEIREKLPIIGEEQNIVETIHENDVVIVCGETGSGKTTQIPQFLYEAGYGTLRTHGRIAVTEPRRVAAINMSKRVAYEMGLPFGQKVGYHIRNNKFYTESTVIKFCTDGVLLREAEEDLLLSKYSVIIIDEAHERTVNTDVLIGLLSRIVVLRRKKVENGEIGVEKLKLIIMSATLRVDDFLKNDRLFEKPPPLIKIDARQFPVSTHFARNTPLESERLNAVKHSVEMIHEKMPPGGILVFLPGKLEIQNCVDYFRSLYSDKPLPVHKNKSTSQTKTEENEEKESEHVEPIEVEDVDDILDYTHKMDIIDKKPMRCLPLYSLLPQEEQDKVFQPQPEGIRLVVFSTNIAETSVTIPNIKYVVDLGLEKSRVFDFANGVISTTVDFISQASAEQRKGRAGRTGPGQCFRLYSSAIYSNNFEEFTKPEIQRRPITEVVLLLKTMGLNDISRFPFPTLITKENLDHAEMTLKHIGLLELEFPFKATLLGKLVSAFPIEPRLGKLIVSARKANCLEYAIILAAALDVREPFNGTPCEDLISSRGDPFTLLNVFGAYLFATDKKKFCFENHVSMKAMEEIQQIRQQLTTIIWKNDRSCLKSDKAGKIEPYDQTTEVQLASCLFASYCDHVAKYEGKGNNYITCDNKLVELRGNSGLFDKKSVYITYVSIDETNGKNRFNNPTKISPLWINQIGSKLFLDRKSLGQAEYRENIDSVVGRVEATFGQQNWRLPPADIPHPEPYRAFAAAFLEGKVIPALKPFASKLTAAPTDLKNGRSLPQRLLLIVAELKRSEISTRRDLEARWIKEPLFLLSQTLMWYPEKSVQTKLHQGWPFRSSEPVKEVEFSDSSSDSDD